MNQVHLIGNTVENEDYARLMQTLNEYKRTNGFGRNDRLGPIFFFFAAVITIASCAIGASFLSFNKIACMTVGVMALVAIIFLFIANDTRASILRVLLHTRGQCEPWKKLVRGEILLRIGHLSASTLYDYRDELGFAFDRGSVCVPYYNEPLYDVIARKVYQYDRQDEVQRTMTRAEQLLEQAQDCYFLALSRLQMRGDEQMTTNVSIIAERIGHLVTASVAIRHPTSSSWNR